MKNFTVIENNTATSQFLAWGDMETTVNAIKFVNPTATISNRFPSHIKVTVNERPECKGQFITARYYEDSDIQVAIEAIKFTNPYTVIVVKDNRLYVTCIPYWFGR